jgi:hypothetical protein
MRLMNLSLCVCVHMMTPHLVRPKSYANTPHHARTPPHTRTHRPTPKHNHTYTTHNTPPPKPSTHSTRQKACLCAYPHTPLFFCDPLASTHRLTHTHLSFATRSCNFTQHIKPRHTTLFPVLYPACLLVFAPPLFYFVSLPLCLCALVCSCFLCLTTISFRSRERTRILFPAVSRAPRYPFSCLLVFFLLFRCVSSFLC